MTFEAKIRVELEHRIGNVPDRLFGTLVEHVGRCVYGGIYEPAHPAADEEGFRTDVIQLVKELGITTVRYPGGNFVSGYRWEDGVGEKNERPQRLDLAWHSTESNHFGLHEMVSWLRKTGRVGLMEAVNLGTRGLMETLDLLEYSNIHSGTELSDLRKKNGSANGTSDPFGINLWCLGNEMDGPWQLGHMDAKEYGKKAARVAAGMRQLDPNLELVLCGSSFHKMPTFGQWEMQALAEAYEQVDYLSMHAYYYEENNDTASFLASADDMDSFIKETAALIASVKAQKRSSHEVSISFDEWNIWYSHMDTENKPTEIDDWPLAPALLEDEYSVLDAVVFGDLLMTLLNNVDTVKIAAMAQLVNVISPIRTEKGGKAWKQTTFYPFSEIARRARGGVALRTKVETPFYKNSKFGNSNLISTAAIKGQDGALNVFIVNRSQANDASIQITIPRLTDLINEGNTEKGMPSVSAFGIWDADMSASNTLSDTDRVSLRRNPKVKAQSDTLINVLLPPVSWTAVTIG